MWGAVNGAAAAAGPLVGGLLTEHFDWRWIFLVNLPVCLAAAWFAVRGLAESSSAGSRVDVAGTATVTLAAGAVVYGLTRATQAPTFAYLPLTTVWLQQVLGHGPVGVGLLGALPMSAAALVVGALAGGPLQRVPPRITVGVGLLFIGGGAALQARLDPHSGGSVLPTLASAVLAAVPRERSGMASGALNTFRQVGFALGVADFGAVFQHRVDAHGADPRAGFAAGLNAALLLAAALAAVAAVLVPATPTTGAIRTPRSDAGSDRRQTAGT